MESRDSALVKAEQVAAETESRKLREAAKCLREGIRETTTYLPESYPVKHRRRIRTNTMIERLDREIRRRTRVVGSFPGWQIGIDARQREDPLRDIQRLVHPTLPGHVPTPRHHERSELNIVPMTGRNQSAQTIGHYLQLCASYVLG
jgi:hypothetical protein